MRRRKAPVREVMPDPIYGNKVITKFINSLMYDGKKSVATEIMYGALKTIDAKGGELKGIDVFNSAIDNVKPIMEVKSRRVGGASFQIPMPIRPDRKISMAMKWMILYARKRNDKSMASKLAAEILAAAKEEGAAVKKRMDTHKMAEANKAFSHFRF